MAQLRTSHTSNSAPIAIDVSFVKSCLFDVYDELEEASTVTSVVQILNKAFADHEINFVANHDRSHYSYHEDGITTVGIVEAETLHDGTINVTLWNEITHMTVDTETFNKTARILSAVIRHELVHREQTIRSNAKCHECSCETPTWETWETYYTDRHELRAFAHEIIENLHQKRFTKDRILAYMAQPWSHTLLTASSRYYEMHSLIKGSKVEKYIMNRLKKIIYQVLSN